ncbi:MAG: hypothetical protein NC122_00060 [Faecalibacterium sp.]|nr:hypothetical protein [Ruminococcus sp.]MCM1391373.1 hypothetical protein [Ruminococcus sp.]MCM1484583.1 hypothetical protein [Faecalibacterium sp.]
MKKVLAIFLSILCVFSLFGVTASANDMFEDDRTTTTEESTLYGITYEKETAADVKMMYKPNSSLSLDGPGYVYVTKDTPLAIDHEFICWRDLEGNLYYGGDPFYVDGEVTLYAVWEEKKDNDPYLLRLLKTVVQIFQRMLYKALGVFEDPKDFDSTYVHTTIFEVVEIG